ncbi:MAG: hypothetical protein IEMM0008_0748 [bacterium]|nr:MAG: hypothetical protein IEMM0008_0748 [bacterium]
MIISHCTAKYVSIIILLSMLLACTKKLITNQKDETIHPDYKIEKQLQVAEFVNKSNDSKLDSLSETIPQFLRDDLSDLKKIRLAQKQIVLSNKKKVLKAQKAVEANETNNMNRLLANLKGSSPQVLSKPISKSSDLKDAKKYVHLDRTRQSIREVEGEESSIEKYLQYYEKNRLPFKPYLGVDINKPIDIVLKTFKLKVSKKLITLKSRRVFQLSYIHPQLSKSSSDLTLVGILNKKSKRILVQVKIYDKHNKRFLLSKDFYFKPEKLSIDLEKEVKKISKYIIRELTHYPKGTLIVKTRPKGAYIFLDNKHLGRSNFKKPVAVGYHKIEILKNGYRKKVGSIFIQRGKAKKLTFKLNKKDQLGGLLITSEPSGADTFVDLKYVGKTPVKVDKLSIGIYKVRIEKKGYKYSYTTVAVKGKKHLKVSFRMRKGVTKYKHVNDLSKDYNVVKNVFFYSSFVSITAMIFAYLQTAKYSDRFTAESGQASPNTSKLLEYQSKFNQSKKIKNATVGTTIVLLALTALFQILELHAEDIEVGFTPKIDESKDQAKKGREVGANFQIQLKF